KWAAIGGGLATIALGITVVVLMTRKPTVIVVPPAPNLEEAGGKKVADKPITVDTGPNQPAQPAGGAASPADNRAHKPPPPAARAGPAATPRPENHTEPRRTRAALYGDGANEQGARSSAPSDSARGGGSQVSQQAIMAVVTQNRRSLNLCYDRVLKHDSSLKS